MKKALSCVNFKISNLMMIYTTHFNAKNYNLLKNYLYYLNTTIYLTYQTLWLQTCWLLQNLLSYLVSTMGQLIWVALKCQTHLELCLTSSKHPQKSVNPRLLTCSTSMKSRWFGLIWPNIVQVLHHQETSICSSLPGNH